MANYQRGLNHDIMCMMGVAAIFTLADVIEMSKRAKDRLNWQPRQPRIVTRISGNPIHLEISSSVKILVGKTQEQPLLPITRIHSSSQ